MCFFVSKKITGCTCCYRKLRGNVADSETILSQACRKSQIQFLGWLYYLYLNIWFNMRCYSHTYPFYLKKKKKSIYMVIFFDVHAMVHMSLSGPT